MPRPKSERPTYSLAKRSDAGGGYYVQWWEDGHKRRVSCRTSEPAEARRFLAEFQVHRVATPAPRSPTIGQVLDGYLSDRIAKVHSLAIKYDVNSLKRRLADLPVDLLTNAVVQDYMVARRAAGARGASAQYRKNVRPLSDGTLIRELGTLRYALAWAVRGRWIDHAPHVERPSAPPSRERWLTHDEAIRLLEAADAPHVRVFIALALYTGARAGALLQLTWDRVDLERGTLNLGESRGRKRRPRVPIVDDLRAELATAFVVRTRASVVEYGGQSVASVKTGFRAAVRRAGLTGVTPHVLRHTAATWMMQRNVPVGMIAAWLGNTPAMVEKVYGHHSPEWLRQAAGAFSRKEHSL